MTIKEYIPSFVSGFENKIVKFSTMKELLEIDFVKSWSKDKGFLEYQLSENSLMAIFSDGNFYVIGDIDDISNIDLQEWHY